MFHPSDSGEILEMSRVEFGPGLLGLLIDLVSGLEFRLSSVRFGSVSVTIFGFWFSCQPTCKFDGETTT